MKEQPSPVPDVVERLRAWADLIESGYEVPAAAQTMREAASLIEALREALKDCADDLESELRAKGIYDTPRKMALHMETVFRARELTGKVE